MKRLAALYAALDRTTSTNAKIEAIVAYLADAPAEDAIWTIALLRGDRPRRPVKTAQLRAWAAESAGIPDWLFDRCYQTVGDLAETMVLVQPPDFARDGDVQEVPLHVWCEERLPWLRRADDEEKREALTGWWRSLPPSERFVLNKLITGGLRVGVSKGLVERALAQHTGLARDVIAHRLMGAWERTAEFYRELCREDDGETDIARPYPFFLATPIADAPDDLGAATDWQFEWKWDGIRGQLIRRAGETFLWSRGEELVNDAFPDIVEPAAALPDGTVLDGELLVVTEDGVASFQSLQRRLQRKKPGPKVLRERPVRFRAYDLMEHDGVDVRALPLRERRARLEALAAEHDWLDLSESLEVQTWDAAAALRQQAQDTRMEGLMVKRLDSPYRTGRVRGDWWKWKVDPYTLDAVLLYGQAGHGRRATLFTDYTFALRDGDALVPFAKAYSGLDDAEIRELDAWIKANTIERFGPVRSVPATHVFEIAFEGIARSTRHKSGVAVRFPRIARWRRDKHAEEADTLAALEALLARVES